MTSRSCTASFSTTIDALHTLMALLSRHAYLPMENLQYNRNFVQILAEGFALMKTLGDKAHPPVLGPCDRLQIDFTETTDAQYDQTKLQDLRRELLNNLAIITDTALAPVNIEQDFATVKQTIQQQAGEDIPKQIDRAFAQMCRLSPFIYDHDGNALPGMDAARILSHIQSIEPTEIDNLYNDFFPQHLAPLLIRASNTGGFGNLHKITRNTLNQFIPKVVHPAIQLYSSDKQQIAQRTITLETIPPIYSPLRGALAGDCSMVSVPYYGLHRNSHTFWIRKDSSFDTKPAGYVILTMVDTAAGSLPYVITINGVSLTQSDTLAVFHLLASHFKTETLLITDISINIHYVNTGAIKLAFLELVGDPLTVSLPEGWETISNYTHSYLQDYYRESECCYSRMVKLKHDDSRYTVIMHPAAAPYQKPEDLAASPILSRAITAYYYESSGREPADVQHAQKLLNVSENDLVAIQTLVKLYRDRHLSVQGFMRMHQQLGFGLKELSKLEMDVKAPLLRELYETCFELFPEHEWIDLVTSLNQELCAIIADNAQNTRHDLDYIKDLKIALPDVYIPNYWDEVRPLLFLANGYASAYHCQRYVKSFHSVGTIEAFLDFLLEFPHLLESLDTEYNRWSDYFSRARRLLGDTEKVQHAIQHAYVRHLLDTEKSHTCYHLARSLVEYERILGHDDLQLKQNIIDKHFTQQVELDEFNQYHAEYSTKVNV